MNSWDNLFRLFEVGGFTMYVLFFSSLLMLEVILERAFYFYQHKVNYAALFKQIKTLQEKTDFKAALQLCQTKEKGLAILAAALGGGERELITLAVQEARLKFEAHLPVLATLGVASPFLGLLGTVLGIIRTFSDIAQQGSTHLAVVSRGVSEALVNTAGGLLIAIISVVFYNLFKAHINAFLSQAETLALKLKYLPGGKEL
jgi:biopolymer transport protein ExbB/TolQ